MVRCLRPGSVTTPIAALNPGSVIERIARVTSGPIPPGATRIIRSVRGVECRSESWRGSPVKATSLGVNL